MDRQDLEQLVHFPRETLGTELKAWLDPSTPEDIGKIARACIALWNNNGGCLIIGIQDNGQPDPAAPVNVQDTFHPDVIQAIVSKYASLAIPVTVEFIARDGVEYPVICVPSGVQTPAAAKADLPHPLHTSANPRAPLVRCDTVYVRTLNANNIVSSAPARWNDWSQIVRNCFDNREADIGAFIRRQLATVDPRQLRLAVKGLRPAPLASELAVKLLDYGRGRFMAEANKRGDAIPDVGTIEAAIVIDRQVPQQTFGREWFMRLRRSAPDHSGWPFWIDMSQADTPAFRPYVFADGYESLVFYSARMDFWRIDPKGHFYCLRALWDDMGDWDRPKPGTLLDQSHQVMFVAEILSICQSFARTMGCIEQQTALECAFRWSGIEGRQLGNWSDPHNYRQSRDACRENSKTTQVRLPLETPPASLAPFVDTATKPLFAMFGGDVYPYGGLERRVTEVLNRRF